MNGPRIAVITNGNFFSRVILDSVLRDSGYEIVGIVVVTGVAAGKSRRESLLRILRTGGLQALRVQGEHVRRVRDRLAGAPETIVLRPPAGKARGHRGLLHAVRQHAADLRTSRRVAAGDPRFRELPSTDRRPTALVVDGSRHQHPFVAASPIRRDRALPVGSSPTAR